MKAETGHERYHLVRRGWKWHVTAGTGTRSLGGFWRKLSAQRLLSELVTAYEDGRFVERRH